MYRESALFFPDKFYLDLGVDLARVAADLEAFLDHQQSVFGDLHYECTGDRQPQHHVKLRLPSGQLLKVLTFPARSEKNVNPDVQFGAVENSFPSLDIGEYRASVLRRLGDLIKPGTQREHRFVKFSYDGLREPTARVRAVAAFEWLLCELRCAGAAENARQSVLGAA